MRDLRPSITVATTLGWLLVTAAAGASFTGCGGSDGSDAAAPAAAVSDPAEAPDVTPVSTASAATPTPPKKAKRPSHERPLPAFGGITLDDRKLEVSNMLGKRYVLYVFNPEIDIAPATAQGVVALAALRGKHNFEILGVATSARRAVSQAFVAEHGLDFPVLDDSSARIAATLRTPVPVLLASVDGEGYVTQTLGWPEGSDIGRDAVEKAVREMMRLPVKPTPVHPVLGERPPAPQVAGTDLSGKPFDLEALRGRAVVVVFFLHTCPHCHHALGFLKKALPKIPEDKRPVLVGVSVVDRAYAVRERMKSDGLDFFPILMDPGSSMQKAYAASGGVPVLALVDPEGRIAYRSTGWDDELDPPLWQMWLAKVGGAPVPMLLHRTGYSGNKFCGVCHEAEATTWAFTKHAYAFDTLVKHGEERNPECVSCHVVGFGQAGGFALEKPSRHLESVGCETCHGRGGPHLSPDFAKAGYESQCVTCHDKKHSLGFSFPTFHPKISHAVARPLLALSLDEKLARIEALGVRRKALLPTDAAFVGSDACQSCHPAEFETWASGAHANAGSTLATAGKAGNAECLACHTTGFGKDGGFPEAGPLAAHADLGRVGCESCHGPGADHVAADAPKVGSILSLGDKCDSCVILQICGDCHDDANDPGFEFAVQDKIDAQRHGTIEPGTGKPKAGAAAFQLPGSLHGRSEARVHALPDTAVLGTLERAFDAEPAS